MNLSSGLVVDNRASLQGRPGLHALIAGVSAYPHLPVASKHNRDDAEAPHYGLRKLASPALSAYRLARALMLWNSTLTVPLATIRLLLTASPEEKLFSCATAQRAVPATLENFARQASAWRDDCAAHKDNMTFFYFGGHGLQRYLQDQVLLLEGFGDGFGAPLNHGVESSRLLRGMVPCNRFPEMGRRQLFLFDACRITPLAKITRDIERVGDIWPVYDTEKDDRDCAILYASSPGESSYSNKGRPTVFSRAFIDSVNRFAAEKVRHSSQGETRPWKISAPGLASAVAELIKSDPTPFARDQNLSPMGGSPDFIFRQIPRAPRVRATFRVEPAAAHRRASLTLRNETLQKVRQTGAPISPYPYEPMLNAGLYSSELRVEQPGGGESAPRLQLHDVTPFEKIFVLACN